MKRLDVIKKFLCWLFINHRYEELNRYTYHYLDSSGDKVSNTRVEKRCRVCFHEKDENLVNWNIR